MVSRVDRSPVDKAVFGHHYADEEPSQKENERFEQELPCWNMIYWPLCVEISTMAEAQSALRKHSEVVVLGWDACHDLEVLKFSQDIAQDVPTNAIIFTGSEAPPAAWLQSVESGGTSSGYAPSFTGATSHKQITQTKSKNVVLTLDRFGEVEETANAIFDRISEAGCGSSFVLLVVSRAFQSRRVMSIIHWYLHRQEFSSGLRVTALTYSWDPQAACWEDCRFRGQSVLTEAQLLVEMYPGVYSEEEGQDAEFALSHLLQAHPMQARAHWNGGFYSKPVKDRASQAREGRTASYAEWQYWQHAAPLSLAARKAAAAADREKVVIKPVQPSATAAATAADEEDDDDDDEPPPLESHE